MRLAKKEEKNLTWAVWEMLVFYLDLHLEWPYFDRWNLVSEGLFWESVYCLSKCRHCLSISLPFQKSIESLSLRQWNKLYTKKIAQHSWTYVLITETVQANSVFEVVSEPKIRGTHEPNFGFHFWLDTQKVQVLVEGNLQ